MAMYIPPYRNPFIPQMMNFMQNIMMMRGRQNFAEQQRIADRAAAIEQAKQLAVFKGQLEGTLQQQLPAGDMPSKIHGVPQPGTFTYGGKTYRHVPGSPERTASVKNYEYALAQHLAAPNQIKHPGSYTEWLKSRAAAGASRITIGEKVLTHKLKKQTTQEVGIEDPRYQSLVEKDLAVADPEWNMRSPTERGDLVFQRLNKNIVEFWKTKGKVAQFGSYKGKEGWYIVEGNKLKLVKGYVGRTPMDFMRDLR